jgi:hypothetical protein
MDLKALDKALLEIVKNRNELSKLDYNNPKYDEVEEQLHDLEDDFHDEYGEYLEEILQTVHDEICPDTDVLFPVAYIAKTFKLNDKNEFIVKATDGVFVEIDKYAGKETKLVLVPMPLRVVLNVGEEKQIVVWTGK